MHQEASNRQISQHHLNKMMTCLPIHLTAVLNFSSTESLVDHFLLRLLNVHIDQNQLGSHLGHQSQH